MAYFIWLCFILAFFLLLSKYDVFKTKTEPTNDEQKDLALNKLYTELKILSKKIGQLEHINNEPKDNESLYSQARPIKINYRNKSYLLVLNKLDTELKNLSRKIGQLKYKYEVNTLLPLVDMDGVEAEWGKHIFEACKIVLNHTQDHSWDKELDLDFYRNIRSEQSLKDVLHFKCTKCNLQLKWNGNLVRWDDSAPNINPYYNASEDIPSCKEHIMNQALE